MSKNYILTISSIRGSKTYIFPPYVKYIFIMLLLLLLITVVGNVLGLYIYKKEAEDLDYKRNQLANKYVDLSLQNQQLNLEILRKEKQLKRLNDFEEFIGVDAKKKDYTQRIEEAKHTLLQKNIVLSTIPSGLPIKKKKNYYISSVYGSRKHPILKKKMFHHGIDMVAKYKTDVIATASGLVVFAEKNGGFGKVVKIRHNYGFDTVYAHLYGFKVKVGDFVKKGDEIGLLGSTGVSTGPHIHYEVRYLNKALNPVNFIEWNYYNYTKIFESYNKIQWSQLDHYLKDLMMIEQLQLSQKEQSLLAK